MVNQYKVFWFKIKCQAKNILPDDDQKESSLLNMLISVAYYKNSTEKKIRKYMFFYESGQCLICVISCL